MADLPVNFKDDILAASMGGKRRYNMIQNEDGTVSFEDVTTYQQEGSNFGAAQINATNASVNGKVALDNVISTLEELQTVTEPGFWIDALVAKSLYSKTPFSLGIDDDGNYGYIKEGADTVTPFSGFEIAVHSLHGFWNVSSKASTFSKSHTCTKSGKMMGIVYASYWTNTAQGTPSTSCTVNGVAQNYINTTSATPGTCRIYKFDVKTGDVVTLTGVSYWVSSDAYYAWGYIGLFYL